MFDAVSLPDSFRSVAKMKDQNMHRHAGLQWLSHAAQRKQRGPDRQLRRGSVVLRSTSPKTNRKRQAADDEEGTLVVLRSA